MPHLTIEYTQNLSGFPADQVLAEINLALSSHPDIGGEVGLRSRCIALEHFAAGTIREHRAFVHAKLQLLSGRSHASKKEMTERIARVLRHATPRPAGMHIQLSIDVVDMDRDSYLRESW